MSNDINDLLNAVRNIDSREDMNRLIEVVNEQNKRMSRMKSKAFSVGDYVYFTDRSGRQVDGVVTKVNPRTVQVKVGMTLWRVDASLLSREPIKGAA